MWLFRSVARVLLVGFAVQFAVFWQLDITPWSPVTEQVPIASLGRAPIAVGCLLIAIPTADDLPAGPAVDGGNRGPGGLLAMFALGFGYTVLAAAGFSTLAYLLLEPSWLSILRSGALVFIGINVLIGVACLLIAIPAPDELRAGGRVPPSYVVAGIYVGLVMVLAVSAVQLIDI